MAKHMKLSKEEKSVVARMRTPRSLEARSLGLTAEWRRHILSDAFRRHLVSLKRSARSMFASPPQGAPLPTRQPKVVRSRVERAAASFDCMKPVGRHRDAAALRANACGTCTDRMSRRDEPAPCLGCGEPHDYFSCAPGYCVLCAHDPCWRKVA